MVDIFSNRDGPRLEDVKARRVLTENAGTIRKLADQISNGGFSRMRADQARRNSTPEPDGLIIHDLKTTSRVDTPEPLSPAGNWFHDVQIQALKDGVEVDWADDWLWGIERVVLPNTVLNQPYIIRIGSNYSEDAIFEAAVTVTSP